MDHTSHRRGDDTRGFARLLRWSETAAYVAGTLLLSLFAIAQADSALGSTRALEDFAAGLAPPDQTLWAAGRVRDYEKARLAAGNPVAVLKVNSLKLEVPVFAQDDEISLNRGAGLVAGMGTPDQGGNVGIAGHRDGFFRPLKDIKIGDLIEVRTQLKVHRYRVTSIDIVDAADKRLLADTELPSITLVTCYPFYYIGNAPQRFIVAGQYQWSSDT